MGKNSLISAITIIVHSIEEEKNQIRFSILQQNVYKLISEGLKSQVKIIVFKLLQKKIGEKTF